MSQEKKISQEIASEAVAPKKGGEDFFADFAFGKVEMDLEEMLKSGMHFGHQKSRRHPRMDEYIFTTRKGVNIIDLEKTKAKLDEALEFLKKIKRSEKQILFVATKKQNVDLVVSLAKRFAMPYVAERWLGGTFTNFSVIKKRAEYLKKSQEMLAQGEFKKYTKFEQMKKAEELEKLEKKMGGIKEMHELPAAVFVTDLKEDELAVREAHNANIPVVAIADTNTDPTLAEYPVPANDDALSSLCLILSYMGKALDEAGVAAKDEKINNKNVE